MRKPKVILAAVGEVDEAEPLAVGIALVEGVKGAYFSASSQENNPLSHPFSHFTLLSQAVPLHRATSPWYQFATLKIPCHKALSPKILLI